jgi:hypothetical protein
MEKKVSNSKYCLRIFSTERTVGQTTIKCGQNYDYDFNGL